MANELLPKFLIISLLICTTAAGYYFYRLQAAAEKLKKWVMERHPGTWNGLNKIQQIFIPAESVVTILHKKNLSNDPEFEQMYAVISDFRRKSFIYLLLGIGCIAVILIGSFYWDWNY
jgi:hypothetical protein